MTIDSEAALQASRAAGVTVFVSDPTAEAERISEALRGAGFQVIDVPLSMLVARVAVQRPQVVIVDADTEGAIDAIGRMREVADCESVDVLFTGRAGSLPSLDGGKDAAGGELSGIADSLAFEGSGFFSRPVDPDAVVRKVRALVLGAPSPSSSVSPAPPSSSSELPPFGAAVLSRAASMAPPPSRRSLPPSAASVRPEFSLKSLSLPPSPLSVGRGGPLSRELERLLAEAEGRVSSQQLQVESLVPTPEEELEAVLPAGVLDALDAPLEDDDGDDDGAPEVPAPRVTTSGGRSETTGTREPARSREAAPAAAKTGAGALSSSAERTNAGRVSSTTEARRSTIAVAPSDPSARVTLAPSAGQARGPAEPPVDMYAALRPGRLPSTEPPETAFSLPAAVAPEVERRAPTPAVKDGPAPYASSEAPSQYGRADARPELALPPRGTLPLIAPLPAFDGPSVGALQPLGPGVALRVLADAISEHKTGTLTVESEMGIRRVVLREGDLVTAASSIDAESLLSFLGSRGDLPRERVTQLQGRLPPHGRHAGAALVAQGALRQDQLWPVLRAHAEWLVGLALSVDRGSVSLDPEPPGRLRSEPSVFGGSTGAEVFVDVVRRTIDVTGALQVMGGRSSRVAEGRNASLLPECALAEPERALIAGAAGETVGDLAANHPEIDVPPMLHALALLGAIEIVRSLPSRSPSLPPSAGIAQLDVDAVRERVRARRDLVDDGDYFSLLGVPRKATSYDIRRAFSALRREFDPSRMLTPAIADLADDLRKIVAVLEEAYEVLGDSARRERYRRAIEDVPPR